MPPQDFDHDAFFSALDSERLARRMTWKQVAEQTGMNASTLTRMAQGRRTDIDGLAALLKWSGLRAESFIRGVRGEAPEPLAEITALLRADPKLSPTSRVTLERIIRATYEQLRDT
jgi:transcriptional regulator with XRE-family HTH domain